MTEGLNNIIAELEQRRMAIDKALAALRNIEEPDTVPDWVKSTASTKTAPASSGAPKVSPLKGRKVSAATRKRMQEAQRLRYAAKG